MVKSLNFWANTVLFIGVFVCCCIASVNSLSFLSLAFSIFALLCLRSIQVCSICGTRFKGFNKDFRLRNRILVFIGNLETTTSC